MKLVATAIALVLLANLHADQLASFGVFECSVPDEWKKRDISPAEGLLHVSPKSLTVGGADIPVMVNFGIGPGDPMSLKEFKAILEKQLASGDEQLKQAVGTARTGHGLLKLEDAKDPKIEIIELNGQEILRSTAISTLKLNGDLVVTKTVSFMRLRAAGLDTLSIGGPLGLVEEYAKDVESIVTSVRLKVAEQDGADQPATAGESSAEGKENEKTKSEGPSR